ncbi:hypothetical protein LCGC14_2711150 [marine sediment metagenome]|uniref:Uncharacterized protein n=1 Tax=marine sediment metagenome TaxID=412755 RepID=A0A0F9A0M9_9ZZZZ
MPSNAGTGVVACNACKHYRKEPIDGFPVCVHAATRRLTPRGSSSPLVQFVRARGGTCGPEGKLFEATPTATTVLLQPENDLAFAIEKLDKGPINSCDPCIDGNGQTERAYWQLTYGGDRIIKVCDEHLMELIDVCLRTVSFIAKATLKHEDVSLEQPQGVES